MHPVIEARSIHKTHRAGTHAVSALRDASLAVDRGELVTIMGPSGSGKSTLLQILGGLDRPTSGSIRFEGKELTHLSDRQMALFRRRHLGFVFQFFHLLPALTVLENVLLPLTLDGRADAVASERAGELLAYLGLSARRGHRANELSGGEMQRVAIARAVIAEPSLLLADEPTGNLDTRAGAAVLELLARLSDDLGIAVIMVTHDPRAAQYGTRTVRMLDGRVSADDRASGRISELSGISAISGAEVRREVA